MYNSAAYLRGWPMKRLLIVPLIVVIAVFGLGCDGTYFVGGFFNPGAASGVVSIVQFSFVSGSTGSSTSVTVVTLLDMGMNTSTSFCGDQRNHFPMNEFVNVTFTPGDPCATLLSVSRGRQ